MTIQDYYTHRCHGFELSTLAHTNFIMLGNLDFFYSKINIVPLALYTSLGYFEDHIPQCVKAL